ncbi:MAG TPA: iron-sulfur cluster carrier protein ApbC [Psychromonas hadalis]|nr:iron-sulfur cluster carrier protein ApbC [Psychromonas hadalis]
MFGKNSSKEALKCLADADKSNVVNKLIYDGLLSIEEEKAQITLKLPFHAPNWLEQLQAETAMKLASLLGKEVTWVVINKVIPLKGGSDKPALTNINNIIVVASGKGGVGKSTVSVNLALALSKNGANVGLLDADVYGPSMPTMLGKKNARPESSDGKLMHPIEAHDLACNSIGFLVNENDAMIWRGPMASKALEQVLNETAWPDLDYLVVDMPPGTGDIQLTMSQSVPVTSSVIVTTPQDVALIDAKKGISMFRKVDTHVAGIIENMSLFTCSNCGHQEAIFGTGGGKKLAEQFYLPYLGELPLNIHYREDTDAGCPTVAKNEQPELVSPYLTLAEDLVINLYKDLQPAVQQIQITELK